MSESKEGSGARLLNLCVWYFVFYAISDVAVKFFTDGKLAHHISALMKGTEFLVYQTMGGTGICLLVIFALRWYRLESNGWMRWGPLSFPQEYLYIIPSGLFTAVVIVTTTLMYLILPNVMVAKVIMRGAVIVISRLVDIIQAKQGILRKTVFWQENAAVLIAILAVCTKMFSGQIQHALGWFYQPSTTAGPAGAHAGGGAAGQGGDFDFIHNRPAMIVLSCYIAAYCLRIYIMNYFKNTRGKGVKQDNNGFFGIEQISASTTIMIVGLLFFFSPTLFGWSSDEIHVFRGAIQTFRPMWGWAVLAGCTYGGVAFFSVFIFIYKGTTATFAGLVNRLTSLLAGTAATVVTWKALGGSAPKPDDWVSLGLILVAILFLTVAEWRRSVESAAIPGLGVRAGTGVWTGPQKP